MDQQGHRKKHITAEVVEKEYCQVVRGHLKVGSIISKRVQAKKAENRFRVKQGTKFYRVKCKSVERGAASSESLTRSLAQSQPL